MEHLPWPQILQALLFLNILVTGWLASIYFRQKGGHLAEVRLAELRTNHIAEAESYISFLRLEVTDLQGRLEHATKMLDAAEAEVDRLKQASELIG
jgi:hypothetical protein